MKARAGAIALLVLGGCAAASDPAPPERGTKRPPLSLRPVEAGPSGDFVWRQQVTVRYRGDRERSFDAVLQKRGKVLSLVGLTPLNTITFVVEQRGDTVTMDNRTGEALPFDGRYVMQDVQRVFFPWLDDSARGGVRAGAVDGLAVEERLVDGRVVERRFLREGKPPVVVRLKPRARAQPPVRAVLEDPVYGYRLVIETAPPAAAPAD